MTIELGKDIRLGAGWANTLDALEVLDIGIQERGDEHG
jgi:hypothetical protein